MPLDDLEEGLPDFAAARRLQPIVRRTRADRACPPVRGRVRRAERDLRRQRLVRVGPQLAGRVVHVAAEHGEGVRIGGRPHDAADVAQRVARRVDQVEGAVAEVVEGVEAVELEGSVECYLAQNFAPGYLEISIPWCLAVSYCRMAYLSIFSWNWESLFSGYGGRMISFALGPTTISVVSGNVEGSPTWSR